jgi:fructokinase
VSVAKAGDSIRIGVDLGGTKIEAVALDAAGEILVRRRVPTPTGDADGTIRAIVRLVEAIEAEIGGTGTVGVGTPGALSARTGLLRNSNSTCLNGLPLDRLIAEALGRPVRIANDANCFTLSEAVDGAAAGECVVFGVILGTGVGGGIAVDGRVVTGRNAIAGEWGHNPLPRARDDERPGPPCYCGRQGCIETFLSGPALVEDHRRATGETATAEAIAAAAAAGDSSASATLDRYVDRLARALASVVNLLDPDAIVLGGGLSRIERLFRDVPGLWGAHVFSDAVATRLVPARHGDSSGVRGAAWLWSPQTGHAPAAERC